MITPFVVLLSTKALLLFTSSVVSLNTMPIFIFLISSGSSIGRQHLYIII